MCVSPYGCSVEAKKLRDPQWISSLNEFRSLITVIPFWFGTSRNHPQESPSNLLCKVYGDKSDDTALLSEHVIILYLLCCSRIVAACMRELNYVGVVMITSGMCSLVWGETMAENSLGLVLLQRGSFFDDCFSTARNTIFVK